MLWGALVLPRLMYPRERDVSSCRTLDPPDDTFLFVPPTFSGLL
jgi:hypothetical protein